MNSNTFQKQIPLKGLLIVQTLALLVYTFFVGSREGWNFLAAAASNVSALSWNGQFSLDFSCYLLLSGIWIMWRGKFGLPAIVMALLAMIMGIVVFAPYLLYLLIKEKGNIQRVLLGDRKA